MHTIGLLEQILKAYRLIVTVMPGRNLAPIIIIESITSAHYLCFICATPPRLHYHISPASPHSRNPAPIPPLLPPNTRKIAPPRPIIRLRLDAPIPRIPHRLRDAILRNHRRHIGIPLRIRILERLATRCYIRKLRHGVLLRFEDGASLDRAGVCVGLHVDADGVAGDEAVAD